MKPSVADAVKAMLETDETMTATERKTIMDFCRNPSLAPQSARRTPHFMTIEQVADRWQVSDRTVWRRLKDGQLRFHRIGGAVRIEQGDVEAFEEKTPGGQDCTSALSMAGRKAS